MSIEKVREYLKKYGRENDIMEFDQSSATVELAAKAIGCEPERIAKSITLKLPDETPIMIVAAGNARIDNHKYKSFFGAKAKMLGYDEVEPLIGHAVGGVCPFAVNSGVRVFLDESLKAFDYVYPAAGSQNSAIKLGIDELYDLAKPEGWADVCKLPQSEL